MIAAETKAVPLPQGVHFNVSPRDYHAWAFNPEQPALGPISNSLLKDYATRGPLAFRYGPRKGSTAAMSWGSLVDCLLFTPEEFPREFVCKEQNPHLSEDGGVRSKAAKLWVQERIDEGAVLIKNEEKEEADKAVERIKNTPIAAELLDGAQAQVALVHPGNSGIPVKALVDIVPHHLDHDCCLIDLKTTAANIHSDDELARQVGNFKYHWQASLYLYCWNKLNPKDKRTKWKIVWQSSAAPYEVRVTELDELWLEQGQAQVQAYMARLISDMKTGAWLSPFRSKETTLFVHSPIQYAEERRLETLEEIGE
jgi:hypothetical protein